MVVGEWWTCQFVGIWMVCSGCVDRAWISEGGMDRDYGPNPYEWMLRYHARKARWLEWSAVNEPHRLAALL